MDGGCQNMHNAGLFASDNNDHDDRHDHCHGHHDFVA